jgi:hypothetical protein
VHLLILARARAGAGTEVIVVVGVVVIVVAIVPPLLPLLLLLAPPATTPATSGRGACATSEASQTREGARESAEANATHPRAANAHPGGAAA